MVLIGFRSAAPEAFKSAITTKPELQSLHEKQLELLPNLRAEGTNYQYTCAWERYVKWCEGPSVCVDPYTCEVEIISLYLTSVLEKSMAKEKGGSPAPVLSAIAAITYFRKVMYKEDLGKDQTS